MDITAFMAVFGCIAAFIVIGIVFAIFSALFGRRRRYGGYYDRPRPWWFMGEGYRRREFFEPGRGFEHHHHHQGGEHFGGGHHGGHHGGGGFGGGGGHHGGHH